MNDLNYRWIFQEEDPNEMIEVKFKNQNKYFDQIKKFRCFRFSLLENSTCIMGQICFDHFQLFNDYFVNNLNKTLFFVDHSLLMKNNIFLKDLENYDTKMIVEKSNIFINKMNLSLFSRNINSIFLLFSNENKNKYLNVIKKYQSTLVNLIFCGNNEEYELKKFKDIYFYDLFVSSSIIFGSFFGEGDFTVFVYKNNKEILNNIERFIDKLNEV